jgi:SAM-dependent methyltransferase
MQILSTSLAMLQKNDIVKHAKLTYQKVRLAILNRIGEPSKSLQKDSGLYWNEGDKHGIDLKDYSHWRDHGPFKDGRWEALGRLQYQMFEKLVTFAAVERPIGSAIEWGCGGGMNAVHYVGEVNRFYGIDISRANLEECDRQMRSRGFVGFRPILIEPEKPEDALEKVKEKCRFFLCTFVYECLPGVEYANRVTKIAHDLLVPGGLAMIQIRYYNGLSQTRPKRANYFKNATRFTSYPIDEFWILSERIGFEPLYVVLVPPPEHYPLTGDTYAYFFMRKPEGSRNAVHPVAINRNI